MSWCKMARSASRSTSGVSGAGTALVRAAAEVWFQDTSYSRQRSGNPRSQNSPESRKDQSTCSSACLRTSSEVRICPPTASAITRAAACTACPYRSPSLLGDRASVDSDADLDRPLRVSGVVLMQRRLDGSGGADRCHGRREGDEEPVAQGLAHAATERQDLVAHDSCLQPQNVVSVSVAARSPQRGRADHIGHHDREQRGCLAAIRQALPPC